MKLREPWVFYECHTPKFNRVLRSGQGMSFLGMESVPVRQHLLRMESVPGGRGSGNVRVQCKLRHGSYFYYDYGVRKSVPIVP